MEPAIPMEPLLKGADDGGVAPPRVRTRTAPLVRAPLATRALAMFLAVGCLAALIVAAALPPGTRGYGSHTALGLSNCQFRDRTGLPCPSCGMTTSFAWFVRGRLAASLYVQPMGTVLALGAACWTWIGLYIAITGRPIYRLAQALPLHRIYLPLMLFAVLAWAWKILLTLRGWDGWR